MIVGTLVGKHEGRAVGEIVGNVVTDTSLAESSHNPLKNDAEQLSSSQALLAPYPAFAQS
jgi:hypothetical protein